MTPPKIRTIDLFAGAGGLTRGFHDAGGFRTVGAVELDLSAAATFAVNFGERVTFPGAIQDYLEVPQADLVIGGPPCQGFSNLGKKDPDDQRNKLWRDFARVVRDSGAQMFVLENVDRFAKTPEAELLARATRGNGLLKGFKLLMLHLNAADFGTPQKRKRTVIIGSRLGEVASLTPTHGVASPNGRSWLTVRDAIGDLDVREPDRRKELPAFTTMVFGQEFAGYYTLEELHFGRRYEPESLRRYAHISPGGNRFDLPDELMFDCWRKHKSGAGDVLGRLRWDEPSVTIRTEFFKPEKGRYLHPQWGRSSLSREDRALSHAEAARLQGFDDTHLWVGSKVEIARQIGNAVPPPLAKAIAVHLRPVLRRG